MPTAAFVTFGCKLNQYETEAIREEVLELGYREVPPSEPADVYVVNTCSVTAESGAQSRRAVLKAARTSPRSKIIVVGCSTPSERERMAAIPQVTLLAGNEEKALVASFLEGGWRPGEPFPPRDRDILQLSIARYEGRTRAHVKVQDGCDGFCSFCIIPFLRGRSRSRHPDAVEEEVRRLVENGYREVVVTGVHIQDYGGDLDPPVPLAELLRRVARVPGLERARVSSIGPRAFTPELLEAIQDPVFCPHWHLPLQSGSDHVLARMRRDYRLDDFRRIVDVLRERLAEPSFSTDVIVGHPGEEERHFEETLAACRELRFAKIHIFPFSLREGTLASKLGGHVEPLEVRRRARELARLEAELALEEKRRYVGETLEDVLVEGAGRDASSPAAGPGEAPLPPLEGLTRRYHRVRFAAPSPRAAERFRGTVQPVRVIAAEPALLHGEWAGSPREAG
ncbi:MAG: tRNA (N(6)-L-threonylcarbamoyladenosine(37)-C(2))-methylthiotransferase MtaB [Planctomycetes bacterium]|nr:tRNA (N(6)-L-threonylcarbamoyladenosine(37)-C(2))-methylthiotransferase MtaB [Planctomycetota bacterium]